MIRPAYQQGAFSWCHTSCLSKSQWGAFWTKRRILHLTQVRGFIKLHSNNSFTIRLLQQQEGEITVTTFAVSAQISIEGAKVYLGQKAK
ncbi:hypothetical protein [Anabaena sp. CCY 0017]|uniref:hypothetical protein n=1 Tax=Anabaena sp. CCY 0017 TaxID=3103866 RepID=UPI0039C71A82